MRNPDGTLVHPPKQKSLSVSSTSPQQKTISSTLKPHSNNLASHESFKQDARQQQDGKMSLLEFASKGSPINSQVPVKKKKMNIKSIRNGWAEQDPNIWWKHTCNAIKRVCKESNVNPKKIISIGIAYQMHGLVLIDRNGNTLRDCIIWCDSRAVQIGSNAFKEIGPEKCLSHFLNSPGNFTASKLKWVKDNEPNIYEKT